MLPGLPSLAYTKRWWPRRAHEPACIRCCNPLGIHPCLISKSTTAALLLQLTSSDTLVRQVTNILPGPGEGSNATKPADEPILAAAGHMTIHTPRGAAPALASAVYLAWRAEAGLPTPAQEAAAAAERGAAARARRSKRLTQALRRVAADPKRVRNLTDLEPSFGCAVSSDLCCVICNAGGGAARRRCPADRLPSKGGGAVGRVAWRHGHLKVAASNVSEPT
jgi:hypothetical protein